MNQSYDAFVASLERKEEEVQQWDFTNDDGRLVFANTSTRDCIQIYLICVRKEKRNQGIFRKLLSHMQQDSKVQTIWVLHCSNYMIDYILTKYQFQGMDGDFVWHRDKHATVDTPLALTFAQHLALFGYKDEESIERERHLLSTY